MNVEKKIGRRAAGAYGRCGSVYQKKAAAKAVRRFNRVQSVAPQGGPHGR